MLIVNYAIISKVTYPPVEEEKFMEEKFMEIMFTPNDSPGRAFYEVDQDVDVKCEGGKVIVEPTRGFTLSTKKLTCSGS